MSQSQFQAAAVKALESFVSVTLQGESDAVLNKIARGECLYTYAWSLCREDEDFSKSTFDQHVGTALAAARAKRELGDVNARRWVYWFALSSLGMPIDRLALQPGSVLRALERLVEFQGVGEPGEGETLPDAIEKAPLFSWFDAKAEAVCRRILDRKNPYTGDAAVEAVNKAFPDRIKSRAKGDDAEASSASSGKSSKSSTTVESDSGAVPAASALNPGSLAALVRSYLSQASDDDKRAAMVALAEVMRPYASSARKPQAASAGVGSVAPESVAASAA